MRRLLANPKLCANFQSLHEKDRVALYVQICNVPITSNEWVYFLGIKRETAFGVSGQVTIEEHPSNSVAYRGPLLFDNNDLFSMGPSCIDLHSSDTGAYSGLLLLYHRSNCAQVYPELNQELLCGTYRVFLNIECDGKHWSFNKKCFIRKNEATQELTGGWIEDGLQP
ncbi:hypothetical protein [Nitrospira sp. Ecomares 2.1]